MKALCLLLFIGAPSFAATRAPLGASVAGWMDGFADFPARLERLKKQGFTLVSLVPTFPYIGHDRVDPAGGPAWERVEAALALSLDAGLTVVLKPHLDPGSYFGGYAPADPDVTRGWRWGAGWRGYFDLDPMAKDYREGVVGNALETLSRVLKKRKGPVRLELGAELMTSMAERPERWAQLLDWAKEERTRLGLDGKVLLSYNFEHHFEMEDDVLARLSPYGRRELARFIRGLDALALSQYMDLTVAVPEDERGKRLPTAQEVARAFAMNENAFRRDILEKGLGLPESRIPPIHIGEFGVGTGGLRRPNEWAGATTPDQEKELAKEIALGDEGLTLYLKEGTAKSAALWTIGKHYDVFGWDEPSSANPDAQKALRAYFK